MKILPSTYFRDGFVRQEAHAGFLAVKLHDGPQSARDEESTTRPELVVKLKCVESM